MDKVVVVTGGSRGIGEAIVRACANSGCIVVLNYKTSEEKAKSIKKELTEQGKQVEIYKADVSKSNEANGLIEFCVNKFNKIDVLINNAGVSSVGLITDMQDEEWDNILRTNLTSAFYTARAALKHMIYKQEGNIINISSIWGITGGSCEVAYSASKAGIIGFTKALSKEVGPSNIRVNSIAPGSIETDMNKNISRKDLEEKVSQIPLERIGKPEDIAKCVMWLIEDNYMTGQVISPNGGWVI